MQNSSGVLCGHMLLMAQKTKVGPQLKVCLDLFHAVQHISRKIPKRHPFHSAFMRSLTLVFRDPTDVGLERKKKTPCPAIIRRNLEDLKRKWEGVSYNGQRILPPAAQFEMRSLLRHIDKGCISGIEPGRGTRAVTSRA